MTELLKDLMHDRADSLGAPDLDVPGMVREGNRQVHRRRTAVLGAGVAAVAVAAIAVPTLLPETSRRGSEEPSVAAAFTAHEPSYAIGSEVHIDGLTFDVGHPINAFVQTTAGVVFSDKAGTVWASDGSQTVEVGTTDAEQPHLEADGSRVAWTEYPLGAAPEYTLFDQTSGATMSTPFDTGNDGPTEYDDALFAVDGVDVYFRDSRGVVRWNVETGVQALLGRVKGATIDDVHAGVIAHRLPNAGADLGGTSVYFGRHFGDTPSTLYHTLALSPNGAIALGESDPDRPALADTATGEVTPLDVPGYGFFAGYGWVDDDTFVAVGVNEPFDSTPVDLLECEVGGKCTVTGSAVGSLEGGLIIPIGQSMDS